MNCDPTASCDHSGESRNLEQAFLDNFVRLEVEGTGKNAVVASISLISHLLVVFAVRVMGTFFIQFRHRKRGSFPRGNHGDLAEVVWLPIESQKCSFFRAPYRDRLKYSYVLW